MPTMALCKRWQFISPPIEVGEFLLILVKNGTLHTAVSKEPVLADILIDAGKIVEIAPQINGSFEKVIDASGLDV